MKKTARLDVTDNNIRVIGSTRPCDARVNAGSRVTCCQWQLAASLYNFVDTSYILVTTVDYGIVRQVGNIIKLALKKIRIKMTENADIADFCL